MPMCVFCFRFTVEWAVIELVRPQYIVCEDAGTLEIEVERRGALNTRSSIGLTTRATSAKEGLDFVPGSQEVIEFPPGTCIL